MEGHPVGADRALIPEVAASAAEGAEWLRMAAETELPARVAQAGLPSRVA